MSDELALLDVIRAHPEEDTPRLMYADWLDEHDQPERAEFIRSQIERTHLARTDPRWRALLDREAELTVAAKETWLRPYFLWAEWPNLCIRRGLVERATTISAVLAPHLDSLRELTALLELHLRDFNWTHLPAEEDPEPSAPEPRRGWLGRTWSKMTGLARLARGPDATHISYLCRVSLAERPRGLRVRAVLGERYGPERGTLALDLLAPGPDALEPALCEGEWTVLAWSAADPAERRLVGRLARTLCARTRDAPVAFFRQRVAARPVRSAAEFAPWCPLDLPPRGPHWIRFWAGAPVERYTGFSPPGDWLGGVSL
jgi:uncharacterized protein (TIGR02996 family)